MKATWNTLCFFEHCWRVPCRTLLLLLLLLYTARGWAGGEHSPPHIFYSDLTSAPATGGESGHGAFITLYGSGFGEKRGTGYITIGGERANAYPVWSEHKLIFQLPRSAQSGAMVVHVDGGIASNELHLTVRMGRIHFYPERHGETLQSAIDKLHAGDILYLRDGVEINALDRYESSWNIMSSGRKDNPIAVVAYPGANVTIGAVDGPRIAARTPNVQRTSDDWVIAGLHFIGNQEALDVTDSTDWRLVGNDFTCPHGFGPTGCIEMSQVSEVAFLGNTIHDVGLPRTTKVYHGLYFSTDSNHIDVGWNTIANVRGCRGLQFHSTPTDPGTGRNQYDLHIHDNVIHDTACDGINLATINPASGPVEVFNNLLYNVGQGPDPQDGSANYACIYVQGGSNAGPASSGVVDIYNNTMFRCGGRRNTDSGGISFSGGSAKQSVRLRNNIIVLDGGVPLFSPNSRSVPLQAEGNLIWWLQAGKNVRSRLPEGFQIVDPMLRDPAKGDFRPSDVSPALRRGVPTALGWTLNGRMRSSKAPYGVGAF
jgi:hypothetical protein